MTDKTLRYMIALQPKIREAMGAITDGDLLYCPACQDIHCVMADCLYYCVTPIHIKEMIRLPLPIDPRNPERGLWGMVDWEKWHLHVNNSGVVSIRCIMTKNLWDKKEDLPEFLLTTPTLALLKALAHQEGLEVPND